MATGASRLLAALGLSAVALWWARRRAHAKLPAPEGRWREVSEDELG